MKKEVYDIIVSPIISEKSTTLSEKENKYVFKVDKRANKIEIRKAIETIFKVKVNSVNTMNYQGKKKRVRMAEGTRPSWKKAVVTLEKGQKIEFA